MNIVELELISQIKRGSENCSNLSVNIDIPKSTRGHYLGMSSIANDACFLWLEYNLPKWYKPREFDERVQRILRLGKILEEEIIYYIKKGGGNLSGQQNTFSDFKNKFKGHNDGIWIYDNIQYILEIKTASDGSYNKFLSNPLSISHPIYYGQVQIYMYYFGIKKAIILFYDKNNSEMDCKIIEYDEKYARFLRAKAYAILVANSPKNIPDVFKCRKCNKCEHAKFCGK